MKTILVIFLCITTSLSLLGQEKLNDSIIEYRFNTELKYKELKKDSSFITIQSNENAVKLSLSSGIMPGFVIVDAVNEFTAAQVNSKIDIKPFIEIPKIEQDKDVSFLEKIDDRMYKSYACERYQINDGNGYVELYFLNEPSPNFNKVIVQFLNMMGLRLDIKNMPQGTFVAGLEIKNGVAKDTIELVAIKKNIDAVFTINTKL